MKTIIYSRRTPLILGWGLFHRSQKVVLARTYMCILSIVICLILADEPLAGARHLSV